MLMCRYIDVLKWFMNKQFVFVHTTCEMCTRVGLSFISYKEIIIVLIIVIQRSRIRLQEFLVKNGLIPNTNCTICSKIDNWQVNKRILYLKFLIVGIWFDSKSLKCEIFLGYLHPCTHIDRQSFSKYVKIPKYFKSKQM